MQLGMIGLGRMGANMVRPPQAAIEEAVPADVLATALFTRFRSRQEHTFAEKVLSAMRYQFGEHTEPPPTENSSPSKSKRTR